VHFELLSLSSFVVNRQFTRARRSDLPLKASKKSFKGENSLVSSVHVKKMPILSEGLGLDGHGCHNWKQIIKGRMK
jgi:hypothetical protein